MKKRFSTTRSKWILNLAAMLVLFVVLYALIEFKVLNKYQANLLIPVGINIILAVSLNLAAGFLGQLPLGHAGFMAVGAYGAALFTKAVELPAVLEFPLGLLVGGLAAAFFGVIIGLPALRLHGDYLAIITLGFGEIIRVLILNVKFTGGAFGLQSIPRYTNYVWTFIMVAVTIYCIHTIINSRHGRAIISIREDEIAANASGIPVTYYKTLAFSVSAFFAGLAGGLFAHYMGILDPNTFGFMKSVEILVMVVLGGMGSIIGSVVAATALTLLPEMLRVFSQYRLVLYSLLLIIVMIFKPTGLFGQYSFSLSRFGEKIFKKGGGKHDSSAS